MKKKILIVDGNLLYRNKIEDTVHSACKDAVVYSCEEPSCAYGILNEHTIDIIITEVVFGMGTKRAASGFLMVKKIRSIEKYYYTPIIFITSCSDDELYAIKRLHCYEYIEKPYDEKKLDRAIRQAAAYKTRSEADSYISLRHNGMWHYIMCEDILYIENNNHVLSVHKTDGSVQTVSYITCSSILEKADCSYIFQCSRNTIVNRHHIKSLDTVNKYLHLDDGSRISIGYTYCKKVVNEMQCR